MASDKRLRAVCSLGLGVWLVMISIQGIAHAGDAAPLATEVVSETADAQSVEVVTSTPERELHVDGIGEDLASEVKQAKEWLMAGETAKAEPVIDRVLEEAQSRMSEPGALYLVFESDAEYQHYVDENPNVAIQRVSAWVGMAMFLRGFALVAQQDYENALTALENHARLAPYSADNRVETGYVLNRLGRFDKALLLYNAAEALADTFESQAHVLPLVLRGKGYALIELGRFDEAEAAYRRSLELDPHNALARRELEYIASARSASDEPATAAAPAEEPPAE